MDYFGVSQLVEAKNAKRNANISNKSEKFRFFTQNFVNFYQQRNSRVYTFIRYPRVSTKVIIRYAAFWPLDKEGELSTNLPYSHLSEKTRMKIVFKFQNRF